MSEQESECGSSQDDPSCRRRKKRTELEIFQHLELALMIASTDKRFTIDEVTIMREARHQTLYKLQDILARKDRQIKELRKELKKKRRKKSNEVHTATTRRSLPTDGIGAGAGLSA